MTDREYQRGIGRVLRIGEEWELLPKQIGKLLGHPDAQDVADLQGVEKLVRDLHGHNHDMAERIRYVTRLKQVATRIEPRLRHQQLWINAHDKDLRGTPIDLVCRNFMQLKRVVEFYEPNVVTARGLPSECDK